jgi:hypothetical protein
LDRIEQARNRSKRRFPCLAFEIGGQDAACLGFSGPSGAIVEREAGESLQALATRSAAALGCVAMFAVYPPEEVPEAVPGQSVPSPEPEPVIDVAGIGREDAKYRGYWRPEGGRG